MNVRVGGIYALESLSLDSPTDRPTIIEVLNADVRDHALAASDPSARQALCIPTLSAA